MSERAIEPVSQPVSSIGSFWQLYWFARYQGCRRGPVGIRDEFMSKSDVVSEFSLERSCVIRRGRQRDREAYNT